MALESDSEYPEQEPGVFQVSEISDGCTTRFRLCATRFVWRAGRRD